MESPEGRGVMSGCKHDWESDWNGWEYAIRCIKCGATPRSLEVTAEKHKIARYQIEQECMKLTKENYDLKAEVEDLKRVMEEALNIIGGNMDIVQSQEAYVVHEHALDNAMDLLLDGVAQKEGR
jgi:glycerol dehydrogenase-like iron-containing ADH family enzyme